MRTYGMVNGRNHRELQPLPEEIPNGTPMRKCRSCGRVLPVRDFDQSGGGRSKFTCRRCSERKRRRR